MSEEAQLRESICSMAKSMFDRGLTGGASGNISARLSDGGLLVSPTGSSFGALDPAELSHFDADMQLIGGKPPTKEMPLHSAFTKRVVLKPVQLFICIRAIRLRCQFCQKLTQITFYPRSQPIQ